ncbi:MAG: hypothetical protein Q7J03_05070 [Methanoregula sp.]|nr:hypothetical protein [Methanoregula sp.]
MKKNQPAAPVAQPTPAQAAAPVQPSCDIPPAGAQAASAPAVTEKPNRTWLGIISLIPAILSWVLYPVLFGIIAVVLGIASIYLAKKQGTKFPASAVIAIIIGLLAIILNLFWLDIFPAPQVLPPIR